MDSRSHSETYGCADPVFWKSHERDFCSGPTQGAALPLAQMALCERPGRTEISGERRRQLIDMAVAVLRFGLGLVGQDGSIPARAAGERSPLATSLAAAPMFEAALMLAEEIPAELRQRLQRSALKCSGFLVRFQEPWPTAFGELLQAWALNRASRLSGQSRLHLQSMNMLHNVLDYGTNGIDLPEGLGRDAALAGACLGIMARFFDGDTPSLGKERMARIARGIAASALPDVPLAGGMGSSLGGLTLPFGLAVQGIEPGYFHGLATPEGWHPFTAPWIASDIWHAAQRGAVENVLQTQSEDEKPYGCVKRSLQGTVLLAAPDRGLAFALSGANGSETGQGPAIVDQGVIVEFGDGGICASGLTDPSVQYTTGNERLKSWGQMKLMRNPELDKPIPKLCRWQSDQAYQLHRYRMRRIVEPPTGPLHFSRELQLTDGGLICIDELLYDLDRPITEIRLGGPIPWMERLLGEHPDQPCNGSVVVPPEDITRLLRSGALRAERNFGPEGLKRVRFS